MCCINWFQDFFSRLPLNDNLYIFFFYLISFSSVGLSLYFFIVQDQNWETAVNISPCSLYGGVFCWVGLCSGVFASLHETRHLHWSCCWQRCITCFPGSLSHSHKYKYLPNVYMQIYADVGPRLSCYSAGCLTPLDMLIIMHYRILVCEAIDSSRLTVAFNDYLILWCSKGPRWLQPVSLEPHGESWAGVGCHSFLCSSSSPYSPQSPPPLPSHAK